ncbi:ABC transporter substrate-binding protein [Croceitalea sp. MTPC5]|uniref:ABC transporter substrate-binding protein n=1 Tax=Croceitalea sp. MTPC5 TaxID=3056565 RepID=UPI002B3DC24A|nr:ABC transporter substrate-binding protein [Croceitalea sp. MTPC5]
MKRMRMALDWTANTNHSGFYVAQKKGFYEEQGLEVELLTPDMDNYALTPAKKVELEMAELALCPFESIISYNTKMQKFHAVAIASIFREDISAIVALKDSGINSPKDLDDKVYASYNARYEDGIVKQMIKNDGGVGALELVNPKKLGIWETLLTGKYDATWIFMNWEGVHASSRKIALNTFKMADYAIPYGYSPVIMAGKNSVHSHESMYRSFLKATKKGFLYAKDNPDYAVDSIKPFLAKGDKDIDVLESQKFSNRYYGDETNWGILDKEEVKAFLNWLYETKFETAQLQYQDLVFEGLL